jgi:Transcription factor TFIID complex subunit 8 C-term
MGQTIPELLQYAKKLEDTSLAQNVSDFPLTKSLPTLASFASCNETPPSHIPSFFPAFPDPHTLMETAKFVHTEHTTHSRQQQVTEQQQQGEEALVNIEAREHPESAPLQSAKEKLGGDGNKNTENKAEEENGFLAPVLWEAAEGTAVGATAAPASRAAAADEKTGPLNVEWLVPEVATAAPMPDLNFEGFQMTGSGSRVALATSGR